MGNHEQDFQVLLADLIQPGIVCYDIGAHIGFFTLIMAKLVGPKGKVFAFEPDPENVTLLKEHICRNGLKGKVEVIPKAVWSHEGVVLFGRSRRDLTQGGVLEVNTPPQWADGERIIVTTITLDAFIQEGYPPPHVMKIDVEGGEVEVLKGASTVLLKVWKPYVLCEIHHIANFEAIQHFAKALNYLVVLMGSSNLPTHTLLKPNI
jgi:FkbM family methyltransferase